MAIDDGGQAFPGERPNRVYAGGMSLRDYFASQAMIGIASACSAATQKDPSIAAMYAYAIADAMIAKRRG